MDEIKSMERGHYSTEVESIQYMKDLWMWLQTKQSGTHHQNYSTQITAQTPTVPHIFAVTALSSKSQDALV